MTRAVDDLRREVERIDGEIARLVAERVRVAREIGAAKRSADRGALDAAREAAVVRKGAAVGAAAGLDPEDARDLFWLLIGICRKAQTEGGGR